MCVEDSLRCNRVYSLLLEYNCSARESSKVCHQSDHGTISALKEENYGYCPYSLYLTQGKMLTEINVPWNAIAMDFAGHLSG